MSDLNPIFTTTPNQARQAFDDYEVKAEKNQKVSFGQRQAIDINAQTQDGTESLKLSIQFLSPLAQARVQGYRFGLVAKHRTVDDRKAVEDLAISTVIQHLNEITFRVFLDQPADDKTAVPTISFALIAASGDRIEPTTQPHSYIVGNRDILNALALAENGQSLIFPLFAGSSPNLTTTMKTMTLIVEVDAEERRLEFELGG